MDDDYEYFRNKRTDRVYLSRSLSDNNSVGPRTGGVDRRQVIAGYMPLEISCDCAAPLFR
ncbi:hypothetical protein [Paraburkholderia fungorum]|uniref:hypothetical protein n=1 Tax=Paraburkholderia fungorum TaxID=134537 RepID=UPI001C1EE436|nr:hypothetical protein [Paraburkholderia fungorum]MBU7442789.1 hypothetical protein [Paraburkholderia fungorum]